MTTIEALQRAIEDFLTVDQAAQLANVHPATVRRAFDAGQLDGFKTSAWGRLILRTSAECWAAARPRRLAA